MKKVVLALLASATFALATPALAHDGDDDWTPDSYVEFNQLYQHIWQGIQHGLGDGSYTSREARYFYGQLRQIQRKAYWEERSGDYNPDEIAGDLQDLHDRMHVAHERGHERLDNEWNNLGYGRYGYTPYGQYRTRGW